VILHWSRLSSNKDFAVKERELKKQTKPKIAARGALLKVAGTVGALSYEVLPLLRTEYKILDLKKKC
jgi:hypothetical protein